MASASCRWGIVGTANIARKNWKGIRLAENATLTAVGSRSRERAAQFTAECQSEAAFQQPPVACTYDELLRRADVDAVYIPLPTGIRREWVIRAAEAGKHVLCEKPCAPNSADLKAMIDACQANHVQFMDGVMFMHGGRLPAIRKLIDDGSTLGTLRYIGSQFSFSAPVEFHEQNIRVSHDLEPLGCLGDLGWYNIRFALWVNQFAMPERVIGRTIVEHGTGALPVPITFSGELFFQQGVHASFFCSFVTDMQQWVHVSGTSGSIYMNDFVLPFHGPSMGFDVVKSDYQVDGTRFHMHGNIHRQTVAEWSDGAANAQETNMIRTFSRNVLAGKPDPFWSEIALKTQQVLDACLQSAQAGSQPVTLR